MFGVPQACLRGKMGSGNDTSIINIRLNGVWSPPTVLFIYILGLYSIEHCSTY